MARRRRNMDPYKGLDNDFRGAVDGMGETEARKRLAEVAAAQYDLLEAKKKDGDLLEARTRLKTASATYNEGTKYNKLRTAYLVDRLRNMGKEP